MNKLELYGKIAHNTNLELDEITNVFKNAEKIIFDYLANVQEGECRKIFIMNGLCAESKIVHQKKRVVPSSGGVTHENRIMLTAKISKRYKDKINQNR